MQGNAITLELLDRIHSAILIADFAQLEQLTPALETSMAGAQTLRDAALLAQIRAKAERNAACLMAAGRGVRAAQRRIAEIRDAAQGFSTYDGRGQRAQHGQHSSFARRF
jgi:hypothetical protein